MKKISAITAALVLTVSLAACGGNKDDKQSETTEPTTSTTETTQSEGSTVVDLDQSGEQSK